MASVNIVILAGNLSRDPELRYTQSGLGICNFGLAVSRKWTSKDGKSGEEVCFVDIAVFGKSGEAASEYLKKGSPALVEGRLKLDQWNDKTTGQKRQKLTVTAERVTFLGGRKEAGHAASDGDPGGAEREAGDDVPF